MTEYDLSIGGCYSDRSMSDRQLEEIVRELKDLYPTCGYRIMDGLLRQRGIRVTQWRLREALHRTDPHGTVVRFSDLVQRRKYHVPGPQSMWHIDGAHKLIR